MIGALIAGWVALVASTNFTNNNIRENYVPPEEHSLAANPNSGGTPNTSDNYQSAVSAALSKVQSIPPHEPVGRRINAMQRQQRRRPSQI